MSTNWFFFDTLKRPLFHTLTFYCIGSRIKTSHEFGVVTLDIDSIRSSDVGIYTCKAVNLNGEATCTTSIKVKGRNCFVFSFFLTFTTIITKEIYHTTIKKCIRTNVS